MEILNKNQRNRGIWRLVLLAAVVLALLGAGMVATHRQYAGQGKAPLEDCREALLIAQRKLDGQQQQSEIDLGYYRDTVVMLRAAAMAPNDDVAKLQEKIQELKEDIADLKEDRSDLKTDLSRCESKLLILNQ